MSEPCAAPVLLLEGVWRSFVQGDRTIEVLRGVDLDLAPGTLAAVVGPSGSGKSTLLHVSGLLEPPTAGRVRIEGRDAGGLPDAERTRLRRETIGFVYQFHHLLRDFTALENVVLPQLLKGTAPAAARARAGALLGRLGLSARLHHRPAQLSGGEQQRVAIARALANGPRLVLADEPTGNLDPHTAEDVFALFLEVVREEGAAVLLATHNGELAARCDRVFTLREGRLVELAPHEARERLAPLPQVPASSSSRR
ncbi:Lipoprotein-releasing system ATP-binding protein LolD [bacterium HR39]|nr:Lipoprotein-releasing system ATP-binding protein LolD [bacterium HR39]